MVNSLIPNRDHLQSQVSPPLLARAHGLATSRAAVRARACQRDSRKHRAEAPRLPPAAAAPRAPLPRITARPLPPARRSSTSSATSATRTRLCSSSAPPSSSSRTPCARATTMFTASRRSPTSSNSSSSPAPRRRPSSPPCRCGETARAACWRVVGRGRSSHRYLHVARPPPSRHPWDAPCWHGAHHCGRRHVERTTPGRLVCSPPARASPRRRRCATRAIRRSSRASHRRPTRWSSSPTPPSRCAPRPRPRRGSKRAIAGGRARSSRGATECVAHSPSPLHPLPGPCTLSLAPLPSRLAPLPSRLVPLPSPAPSRHSLRPSRAHSVRNLLSPPEPRPVCRPAAGDHAAQHRGVAGPF